MDGGKIIKSNSAYEYDTNGRITSLEIIYKTDYGTYFEMDGDLMIDRELKVGGSVGYVKNWIREKLRKIENGQIKVVKGSSRRERDWKQEEKIRKQMWEDVNVNEIPKGLAFDEIICYKEVQTHTFYRPPSPSCKIS